MQSLLIERGPVPAGDLPLFPFTNTARLFHAQAQYLASDEVQGLRFISQHAQDTRPVNSVATSLRVDSDTAQVGERAASSFLPAVAPPVGLVYKSSDGLWRLGTNGESQLLTERIEALPSPDAAHAAYQDSWIIMAMPRSVYEARHILVQLQLLSQTISAFRPITLRRNRHML